jgi:aminopeptidase N
MKKIFLYILLPVLSVFIGCGTYKKDTSSNVTETNQVSETTEQEIKESTLPTERSIYRESRTILTDLIHTKLEVSFDWPNSKLNGTAFITAKPHFYASDSLILDAKGMEIKNVTLNNKVLKFYYLNDILKITLDRTYTKSENYTVKIDYVAKPEERTLSGSDAITSDKGLYFINPKGENKAQMPQIWTQGESEASSVWFPTIDSPNMKSTQEIFITVDSKYTTLSNGKLISSKINSNGTRTDYWKQDLPHAPYLFMLAVGEFKVVKDFYTRPDGSKMEVNYYVEPEWEKSAKAIFGETPAMIAYFSKLLGIEFPWDKYSQIVVREYVSGAMENTGAVVFGDYAYKNERELLDDNDQSIIAHELFHHWFGDLVTCESWSNLTLNESLANYSQYLWDEHKYGKDEAAYQAEKEADGYFQSAQSDGYHDLVWFEYKNKEDMFDGHSYNKGGRILHMLRSYLGDEAFFKGLNLYLTTNKFKAAEFTQLRLAFEEVSGEDLNWFFDQWYLGSAHPILDFKQTNHKENSSVTVSIEQNQNLELAPIFKLPIQIAVFDSEGKHVYKVIADKLTQEFTFPYEGTLNCVIVDDQQMLLAKIREEKPLDQYVFQYYKGESYKARRDGLSEGTKLYNIHSEKLILDALKDPFWNIRVLAIEKAVKLKDDFKTLGTDIIKSLALTDPNSQVRSKAIAYLVVVLEKKDLETLLVDKLEKDQSYLVNSTALVAIGKINSELATKYAKQFENESISQIMVGVGQIYGEFATAEVYSFFDKAFLSNKLKGFDQIGMLNSFTQFLLRQDIETIEKSVSIFSFLKENGDFYTKMYLPQFTDYFQKFFDEQIQKLNEEILVFEKNKDEVYANQARQKIKQFEALSNQFQKIGSEGK